MAGDIIYVTVDSPTVESIPTTVGGSPTNVVDVDVNGEYTQVALDIANIQSDVSGLLVDTAVLTTGIGPWNDLIPVSPWSFTANSQPPQWRFEGPFIRIRGHLTGGTPNTTTKALVLPPEAQPSNARALSLSVSTLNATPTANTQIGIDIRGNSGAIWLSPGAYTSGTFSLNFRYLREESRGIPLQGTWANFGWPFSDSSLKIWQGQAFLSGLAKAGATTSGTFSILGSEYANSRGHLIMPAACYSGDCRLDINNSGNLEYSALANSATFQIESLEWTTTDGPSYTAPTLLNSWVNYSSGYAPAGYAKQGDVVWLQGLVTAGTSAAVIFTLPVGYRPPSIMRFLIRRDASAAGISDVGILKVDTNGDVTQTGKTGTAGSWVSLHCNFSVTP